MDRNEAFSIAKDYLNYLNKNNYGVKRAYLFGSYARNNQRADSDIDLALFFDDFDNGFSMQVNLMKISSKFDCRIEPHPFKQSDILDPDPFVTTILQTGELLTG